MAPQRPEHSRPPRTAAPSQPAALTRPHPQPRAPVHPPGTPQNGIGVSRTGSLIRRSIDSLLSVFAAVAPVPLVTQGHSCREQALTQRRWPAECPHSRRSGICQIGGNLIGSGSHEIEGSRLQAVRLYRQCDR
ncbi:hypothetical protein EEZ25_33565 [Micromonospora aurantiaca]|nr:hypothetical protein EEZ25_33565 [Micromonospora aurantiaca]